MAEGFILKKDIYKPISKLSEEQLGQLFNAIFLYIFEGQYEDEILRGHPSTEIIFKDPTVEMAFEFIKRNIGIV